MEIYFSKCCKAPANTVDKTDVALDKCKSCGSQEEHYYKCTKCGCQCCITKRKDPDNESDNTTR